MDFTFNFINQSIWLDSILQFDLVKVASQEMFAYIQYLN